MTSWRPAPDVVCTPLDDGTAALLHVPSMSYFELNATGLVIWEGAVAGLSSDVIGSTLATEHRISFAEATEVVEGFMADLLAEGLVLAP